MHKTILALALSTALTGIAIAQTAGPKFITPQSNDFVSSRVVGLDIYDNSNHNIGKIQDIVFDNSKTIKGYILSVGGFLGMGERYVAVDPSSVAVKYDDNDKKWHANMNATSDELKAAPEFKYTGRWSSSKS
ncbi:MAG: PRC-barrel domain-containing protein [Hyphomicrobiales bacterium]|nr:PRC-barrel domain-containing protein [Hyphomicrobiales bacterium]MBV9051571.1 PRC-barrel domain-containing protein [Hyphomicrobiales bacterium]MBV9135927.1 PRC-barrel domain-containing protein [Hyphomicrobiales bacterium]MBV9975825.1 PRC-barrel domain-containing protein [Hyphomicrobiales bacterium]